MKKNIILSTADTDETTNLVENFAKKLNNNLHGSLIHTMYYQDLVATISSKSASIYNQSVENDIRNYDFVFFKGWQRQAEFASAIGMYLDYFNVPFSLSEIRNFRSYTKLTEAFYFWQAGLPMPNTFFVSTHNSLRNNISTFLAKSNGKLIVKDVDASKGDANYLITKASQLDKILKRHPRAVFVCQEFIENDYDIRALVVDDVIELLIKRTRDPSKTHLNNTSQGANATLLDLSFLSPTIARQIIKATKILNREVAGVDILFDKHGRHFFLEVNSSPQIGSGAFEDEKIKIFSKYFQNKLNH